MAANLQSFRLATIFGKRQIPSFHSLVGPWLSLSSRGRRSVHVSVYEKNPEEQVRVADYVIPGQTEDNYWCPHPQTGVFGPAKDHKLTDLVVGPHQRESVLEQKAFFRPLEDLDKPLYA